MGENNDLLSAVVSNDVVDCVKHLVEYLSCRVFGQAMYRHVTYSYDRRLLPPSIYIRKAVVADYYNYIAVITLLPTLS